MLAHFVGLALKGLRKRRIKFCEKSRRLWSFLRKQLTAFSCYIYLQKNAKAVNSIINNVWKVSVFGISLFRIQSECGKKRPRKTLNTDNFHAMKRLIGFFIPLCCSLLKVCSSYSKVMFQLEDLHKGEFCAKSKSTAKLST